MWAPCDNTFISVSVVSTFFYIFVNIALISFIILNCSGAPTSVDKAPYPYMVNLFSFGCHVIDQAFIYMHASTNCMGGVGETIKRKGGVSQMCLGKCLLYWTFTIWSIDSCQNRIATDQYHMTILRVHVSTHRGDVIHLEAVR